MIQRQTGSPLPLHCKLLLLLAVLLPGVACFAEDPAAPKAAPPATDVLVLANGDTLHGRLVKEVSGKVTFHTDALGDVDVSWDKIKELRAAEPFAVLDKTVKLRNKKHRGQLPVGPVEMTNQSITVAAPSAAIPPTPIPTKNAEYVVDAPTLDKQLNHEPNFFSGWNGGATAGATLVGATQNQYTVSGALSLVRVVPSVAWLPPRHRTSADFSGSYGKITQPSYTDPTTGNRVPESTTKSAIYHIDGERDQYFTSRVFALAQTAFDHNFSQDLQLQQIYGGGFGWTIFNTPRHEADIKGTIQYEKQAFISSSTQNQNLIGSTFAANYMLHTKLVTYAQSLSFLPAYNNARAYSANETNTFTFPAYKNLGFSLGTIDSYLNNPPSNLNPPTNVPPTKRNSFQFTMGLTYSIKSKY